MAARLPVDDGPAGETSCPWRPLAQWLVVEVTARHPLSEQCPAKSKRTGFRCQQWVIGGGPCRMHGGSAPQVRAAREARIVAAEAALEAPKTTAEAADVLLGAMNDSHAILQRLKQNIANGRVTAADLDALGQWVDRASRTAKVVADAGLEERRVAISEAQGALLAGAVNQILAEMLRRVLDVLASEPEAARLVSSAWKSLPGQVVPPVFRAIDREVRS